MLRRELGDDLSVGQDLCRLSTTLWRLCRGEECLQTAEEAVRVLEGAQPSPELAWAYASLGTCDMTRVGRREEGIKFVEKARDLHVGGKWQLGALEWVFPKIPQTPPLANATFGSFPAACHYKDGTFIPDQNANTCPKKASTGATFTFWHPDLVTMHVWIWYPNPAGLYSSTNPLVAPFNGG